MTTTNMGLDLPTVGVTPGPTHATKIKQAIETIDSHDHTSGKGAKLPSSALNLQTDLELNGNSLIEVESIVLSTQAATLGSVESIYSVNGELYFNNDSATPVKITSGSGINLSSTGTIGGDYGSPGVNADVSYSNTNKKFSFTRESGIGADLAASEIHLQYPEVGTTPVKLKAPNITSSSYTITLPEAVSDTDDVIAFTSAGVASFRSIDGTTGETTVTKSGTAFVISLNDTITTQKTFSANNTHSGNNTFSGTNTISGPLSVSGNMTNSGTNTFSGANTFSGNTSGRGILPVGSIIAMNTNLTGVTAVTATTAADANGFVVCSGQVISDVTSPLHGQTIPNLNASYFLMGASTSGSTGGSNSTTLTSTQLPAHYHTLTHGHSNTFALANTTMASSTHTHDMAHTHQWAYNYHSYPNSYQESLSVRSKSTLSFTSAGSDTNLTITTSTDRYLPAGSNPVAVVYPYGSGQNFYTGGATDDAGSAAQSGTPSATTTVSLSGSVTDSTANTSTEGSGSAYDSRPNYYTVKYVIRIK